MLLCNTTAVIITLGFMAFGFWHKRDSGKVGEGKQIFGNFSQTSELNSQVLNPTLFYNAGNPPKRERHDKVFSYFQINELFFILDQRNFGITNLRSIPNFGISILRNNEL